MDNSTEQMKALMQAMEAPETSQVLRSTGQIEQGFLADGTGAMKVLLESIDAPEVDEPKDDYANTPEEEYLDSKTQQDMGRDLNKKKSFQSPRKSGDNTKAGRKQLADLEIAESKLSKRFERFKLLESKDWGWTKKRELADHLEDILKPTPLINIISTEEFNRVLNILAGGDADGATMELMQHYSDHNGGEPRNWQAWAEDIYDDMVFLLDQRRQTTID